MTIDAGWVKLLKKGAPHAFTARQPFAPAAVFIDGQIMLMKSDAIRTWEGFLKCQFLATIVARLRDRRAHRRARL
jgi:hypothetical protein